MPLFPVLPAPHPDILNALSVISEEPLLPSLLLLVCFMNSHQPPSLFNAVHNRIIVKRHHRPRVIDLGGDVLFLQLLRSLQRHAAHTADLRTIVTSLPSFTMFALPKGIHFGSSGTAPFVAYSALCSKNITGYRPVLPCGHSGGVRCGRRASYF